MVISLYYYFGVIRAIYWSRDAASSSAIEVSLSLRTALYACIAGMLYLGLFPRAAVDAAAVAVQVLKL